MIMRICFLLGVSEIYGTAERDVIG